MSATYVFGGEMGDVSGEDRVSGQDGAIPEHLTGGCMCGAVRYRISGRPIVAGLCHCDRCRPQSGGAFSTIILIKRSTFEQQGEMAAFADIGTSGLPVARRYCPRCGSPVTTDMAVAPELMIVKVGGIDANEWFHPAVELFVGRRRPWVAPVPGAQQFEGNPPL